MEIRFLDNREVTLAGEVAEALDRCQEADVAVAFARQSAREVLGEPPSNPPTALCKAYALPPERQREFFHPKLYIFKAQKTVTTIVGSSNFSGGGLKRNIEASVKIVADTDDPTVGGICDFFDRQWRSPWARELTADFSRHYRAAQEARDRLETSLRTQPSIREPLASFRRYLDTLTSQIMPAGGGKWLCITSLKNFWICAGRGLWGDEQWGRISQCPRPLRSRN